MGNAIKFTERGSVELTAEVVGERVEVRVADTGIGISETGQERIFNAFEQADASVERQYGGTGLGLAVTRRLVELHGGEIGVESSSGAGATFFFTLPIAEGVAPVATPQPARAESVVVEEPLPRLVLEQVKEAAEGTLRILVVDDEPVNRQVLSNYLVSEDFDLVTAAAGDEALQLLEEQNFDLVLLDVMMPRISGYEVCRALRETHPMEELPVLFLTARNQIHDVVTGLSLGANDFLVKPIAKSELLARIRPHLALLGTHRHLEEMVEEKISEIRVLEGLLQICATCKKIRNEDGEWSELETFIDSHSEAQLSHGICPDCARELYPSYRS